jgi:hypothetical protein
VWLVVGGLVGLLGFGLYGLLFRVDRQALVQVSGTLAEQPAVYKTRGRNPTKYLSLPIREWRELDFDLGEGSFDLTHADPFVQAASVGDSVQLWVNAYDYHAKMVRTTQTGLLDDLKGSTSQVEVLQLALRGRTYFSVDDYERRHGNEFLVSMVILGLLWVFLVFSRVNGWLPRKP